MPKFFCDYCDVYLTHDSMSVRKAHNSGRNHLRNVQAYYEQISSEQTQQVINSITDAYTAEGQANPLYAANLTGGGYLGGGAPMPFGGAMGFPPAGGFPPPGMPGMGVPPPFMQGGRPGGPPNMPPNMPPFPPNGMPPMPGGMPPFPPPMAGGPPNMAGGPPNMPFPFPPPNVAGSPPGGMPFPPPGGMGNMPPQRFPPGPPGRQAHPGAYTEPTNYMIPDEYFSGHKRKREDEDIPNMRGGVGIEPSGHAAATGANAAALPFRSKVAYAASEST